MPSAASQYVPQTGFNHRPFVTWLIVAILSSLFMAIIVGAPLALANGHDAVANTIYLSFRYVCHQLPERSFFVAGHQFTVCARCTGIYAGFAAATLFYPFFKPLRQTATPARKWLLLAAAPLAIDWAIEFFGIWHNTHSSRFITGLLLGATAVFYVMPGLMELSLRWWRTAKPISSIPAPVSTVPNAGPSDYSAPHRRI